MLNARVLQSRRTHSVSSGGGGGGGSSSVSVNIVDASYDASAGDGAPGAQFILNADGTVDHYTGATVADYAWLLSGSASDVEVMATKLAGGPLQSGSSAVGSWLSLSATRTWGVHKGLGSRSALLRIDIRRTSDFMIIDTAQISLYYDGADDTGTL